MQDIQSTLRVLVVDDNIEYASTIGDIISSIRPCQVRTAATLNGAMLIMIAWKPRLLVLDFRMPGGTWEPNAKLKLKYNFTQKAFAFCEQIRSTPKYNNTVIVIMSAHKKDEQVALAQRAGAIDFFQKDNLDDALQCLGPLLEAL